MVFPINLLSSLETHKPAPLFAGVPLNLNSPFVLGDISLPFMLSYVTDTLGFFSGNKHKNFVASSWILVREHKLSLLQPVNRCVMM